MPRRPQFEKDTMKAMSQKIASRYLKGAETGDRSRVGVFLRLPKFLAEQYPSLAPEDTSPPHVTILQVGGLFKDREEDFLTICKDVIGQVRGPVRGAIEGTVDAFKHPGGEQTVFYSPVRFSHDVAGIRSNLLSALQGAGFEVEDRSPLAWFPHATLSYTPGFDVEWHGERPAGTWEFDCFEVWGLPKVEHLTMGSRSPRPNWESATLRDDPGVGVDEAQRRTARARKVASRYLEADPVPFV